MADIAHQWGSDLRLSATGDLALSSGGEASRERVLRRLLTNAGDYLWQVSYGAGLPSQVGQNTQASRIESIVRRQLFAEEGVGQNPPPTVRATPIFGGVVVQVVYSDAATSQPVSLGFTVER